MKKSEFDLLPDLLVQEGTQMRINFDVEQATDTVPSMDGGPATDRQVFKAWVVRVPMPLSADDIRKAVADLGLDALKAEVVATESMFVGGGSNDIGMARAFVTAKVMAYDSSPAVNEFTFSGVSMWLDDATRTKLLKRFETDEQDGLEETKLIYNGVSYDLPISAARAMLHQIESYARDCFDKTNEHVAAVAALGSVEDVLAYDYTQGYPEKLIF